MEQVDKPKSKLSILANVLGVFFILVGGAKLLGIEMVSNQFAMWGYPAWFMYVVGGVEVIAGIMLFSRPLWWLGALLIDVVMLGAIATHVRAGEWPMVILPAAVFVLATIVLNRSRYAPLPATPETSARAPEVKTEPELREKREASTSASESERQTADKREQSHIGQTR